MDYEIALVLEVLDRGVAREPLQAEQLLEMALFRVVFFSSSFQAIINQWLTIK